MTDRITADEARGLLEFHTSPWTVEVCQKEPVRAGDP